MRRATRHTHRCGTAKPLCARAHLVETRSPWDQHTLARDAPLNPNLLPQYHSLKVLLQSVLRPALRPILESPLVNSAHVLPSHSILQNFFFEHARRGLAGDQPFNVHKRCAHSQFHPWRMAFPYLVSDCRCCLQSCIMHAPGLRPRR